VAPTNSRVLITGPAGSGKEVAARMLHSHSRRSQGPFVAINCAAMDPDELEAQLFGTAKEGERAGMFERAHGGTLLLDEVSELPLEIQSKVVRIMQESAVERVGGGRVDVDVRIIATTNQSLEMEITEGTFREDLYYRLNVVGLKMPSLRERRDDIPTLAHHFLHVASLAAGVSLRPMGEDMLAALQAYDWPGNVRQLRNVMEWLVIMAPGEPQDLLRADMLPPEISNDTSEVLRWEKSSEIMSLPLREAREVFERDYLLAQVNRFGGNISRTAAFIGMERSALHRKLKLLGVNTDDKK
jgi:two-component system nitrogen regulation response regulator NtrX